MFGWSMRDALTGAVGRAAAPLLAASVLAIFILGLTPFLTPHSGRAAFPGSESPVRHAAGLVRGYGLRQVAPLTATNTVTAFPPPPIAARAAYLVDIPTKQVLFRKAADNELPMASTTKITTAAVVLAHARLSDKVTASKAAATIGESTMSLQQGERMTVKDLLYGMLLNSGNDAAVALSEHVGGSQTNFVAMMNALARSLGMRHTHYATPHGLDAPRHYTSARDLATVALYAMQNPTFRKIVATTDYHITKTKHHQEHFLGNINKALFWYPGADGVKPGDTDSAGLCQVVSAWRNGHHVLAVLLHTPNLVTDVRNLLNFGTRDFQWVSSYYSLETAQSSVSGAEAGAPWTYFYGAGHYVRGAFLHYFRTHGGLRTLGLPRTEQITDRDAQTVQFFENAELVYDQLHGSVYPVPLGRDSALRLAAPIVSQPFPVAPVFADLFRTSGGAPVLGAPVTRVVRINGTRVQFFEYGALAAVGASPAVVPVGDVRLRNMGVLPARGIGDWYPPGVNGNLVASLASGSPRTGQGG